MGDVRLHSRLAKEKREAAHDEFTKGRYTVVGDLTIKAVEQAIEALASLEDLHFHVHPKSAHARRIRWFKRKFPELSGYIDMLWGAYGTLGYGGINGDRAKKALEAMEVILNELERKTGIRFK
ncbi:MAG: hypothetical protein DRN53_08450 [Thermoprotei archaeon]|nr:MAG: hypothetical protein DRN53_08450 [Thermoprotei archaeon]